MAPEWIEREQEALKRNANLAKIITRPTEAVEMGGDGKVVDLGEVAGRNVAVEIKPGVEIEIGGRARVVLTARGEVRAIAGGHDAPVEVYDAGKIMPGLRSELGGAISRNRRRRKRILMGK